MLLMVRLGYTHLQVIQAYKLLQNLQVVVSMCIEAGCWQGKKSVWMEPSVWTERQSQNGHLCSTQQQPPEEVPPAGRWDAASHTWHVSGRGSDYQSETLAEQGLLPGMDCVTATPSLCSSLFVCVTETLTWIEFTSLNVIPRYT